MMGNCERRKWLPKRLLIYAENLILVVIFDVQELKHTKQNNPNIVCNYVIKLFTRHTKPTWNSSLSLQFGTTFFFSNELKCLLF